MEINPQYHPDDETWKDQVIPGCYVLCFLPATLGTVYGAVKPTSPNDRSRGFIILDAYCKRVRTRETVLMPAQHVEMPLSKEQFDLAMSLGWPDDEMGLMRIFAVRPN